MVPPKGNAALRDAFFHNGVFHSLREVVQFYVDRDIHPDDPGERRWFGSVKELAEARGVKVVMPDDPNLTVSSRIAKLILSMVSIK